MDINGAGTQRPAAVTDAPSFPLSPLPIDEETLWQMNLRASEFMEPGPFPERPGEPDCVYYIRTGFCRFGMTCRFNHPPDGNLTVGAARTKGGYPERVGQPECQGEPLCIFYFLYGICKFGPNCKLDHPMAMPVGFFAYNLSSSSAHSPVIQGLSGSSLGLGALTLPPEGSGESGLASPRRLSHPESQQMNSGDGNIVVEDSHATAEHWARRFID